MCEVWGGKNADLRVLEELAPKTGEITGRDVGGGFSSKWDDQLMCPEACGLGRERAMTAACLR